MSWRPMRSRLGQSAGVRQVEDPVDAGLSKIRVEEDRPATGLREDDRDVRRGRRLALARDRARDEERANRGVDGGELDARAQAPIGFGDRPEMIEERRQPVDLAAVLAASHLRDRAQRRQARDSLHVVWRLDRVVEVVEQERDAERQQQAHDRRQERVQQDPRRRGLRRRRTPGRPR